MGSAVFEQVGAVLFDLDGTLIDSAPDLGGAADALRVECGFSSLPLSAYRPHVGSGARGMLRVAFDIGPEHGDYEHWRTRFLITYEQRLLQLTRPFAEVDRVLATLASAGLAWGVVTNKVERLTAPIVRGLPLLHTAGTVVCGDTTPHSKPHPAPLLEAAHRLGVEPTRCVFVGDDLRDVQAGRAAGMRTVVAGYGYLGPQAEVQAWGADAHIESPAGVLKLLNLP